MFIKAKKQVSMFLKDLFFFRKPSIMVPWTLEVKVSDKNEHYDGHKDKRDRRVAPLTG